MTSPFMRAAGFGKKKKMRWYKLLQNKCPEADCNGSLERNDWTDVYACVWCEYVITESRFVQLCAKMAEEKVERALSEGEKKE